METHHFEIREDIFCTKTQQRIICEYDCCYLKRCFSCLVFLLFCCLFGLFSFCEGALNILPSKIFGPDFSRDRFPPKHFRKVREFPGYTPED